MTKLLKLIFVSVLLTSCASTPPKEFDHEGVNQVVDNNKAEIRDCYELAKQKDDSLQGKITMAWEVTSGGNARNITVKSGDEVLRQSEPLTNCMIKKIRLWNFPKTPTADVVEVSYPFVLMPEKKSEAGESDSKSGKRRKRPKADEIKED